MASFRKGVHVAGWVDSTIAAPVVGECPVMWCVRPGRPVESWVSFRGRSLLLLGSVMVVGGVGLVRN